MIRLFSASWCARCDIIKDELVRQGVKFEVIDVDSNPSIVNALNIRSLPTVVKGEEVLVNPSLQDVRELVK